MIISLDMMGGDFAPEEAVKGVRLYLESTSSPADLLLIGHQDAVRPLLDQQGIPSTHYKLVHAPDVIGMHEPPTRALKEKPHSSIAIGFHLLREHQSDAFISAGNTGAMMVGTLYTIKTIEGILRPTISTLVPRENGKPGVLLDVGLNADCKPENLVQFALLGTLYARHILQIPDPRVGLLNIGEEEGKGNLLAQATYPLLKQHPAIHFIGNVEGRDLFSEKADVIVCEGFTGNVILKLGESFYEIARRRNIHDDYIEQMNFENYGGTPVLGVAEPVIIGHGISSAVAFKNMIILAEQMIQSRFTETIRQVFEQINQHS
ncbi:MAG: phosphate acyltransferase PlsX [Thermoflavifilum sp.]|jgi:glycerol-3-phosphate acyltransferase PlsX|uniref:phosphate acyltransferase PlsX n=1 Tax=Thermoflavifilum sp. TaxID=1968839 RepID=UPI0018A3BACD|nr:phosphate acyltransferase PlsX [Thermoflavifilum sp.]QOR75814.1 MAG: phosphate acyltransferase PlsX [Thermoflavifilum sp.]